MSHSSIRPVPPVPPRQRGVKMVSYEDFVDRQVERVQSQLRWGDLASVLAQIVSFALAWLVITILVDHWGTDLGTTGRFLALAGFIAGVTGLIWIRLVPRISQTINPAYAAWTVETSHPGLKHRLLNFVLLRQSPNAVREPVLRELQEDAARELSQTDVDESVDQSTMVRWSAILAILIVFAAAYVAFSPKSSWDSFRRMLVPWSPLSRPTRVRIAEVHPGDTRAFTGAKVKVRAVVQHLKDGEAPRIVYWDQDGEAPRREFALASAGADLFEAEIPEGPLGVMSDLRYSIRAGDATAGPFRVQAVVVPTIHLEKVHYEFPSYTGLPARDATGVGDIEAIEGTRVTVYGRANSAIAEAHLEFNVADGSAPTNSLVGTLSTAASSRVFQSQAMEFTEDQAHGEFRLLRLPVGNGGAFNNYSLRFKNLAGELNPHPPVYRIEITPDLAPVVEMLEPQKQESDVAVNQKVRLELRALDPDYQLSDLLLVGVHEGREILRKSLLTEPGPGPIIAETTIAPSDLRLKPGDTLFVWGEARDNRTDPVSASPAPNISKTIRYTLRIVEPSKAEPSGSEETHEEGGDTADQSPDNRDIPPSEDGEQADPTKNTPSEEGSTGNEGDAPSGQKAGASTEKPSESPAENPAEESSKNRSQESSGTQTRKQSGEASGEQGESDDTSQGEASQSQSKTANESSSEASQENTNQADDPRNPAGNNASENSSSQADDSSDLSEGDPSAESSSGNPGNNSSQQKKRKSTESNAESSENGQGSDDASKPAEAEENSKSGKRNSRTEKSSKRDPENSSSRRESNDDAERPSPGEGEDSQQDSPKRPQENNKSGSKNGVPQKETRDSAANGNNDPGQDSSESGTEAEQKEAPQGDSPSEDATDDGKDGQQGASSQANKENKVASQGDLKDSNDAEVSLEKQTGPVSTDGSQDGDAFERLLKKLQEQGKLPKDITKSHDAKDTAGQPTNDQPEPAGGAENEPQNASDSSSPSGKEGSQENGEGNPKEGNQGSPPKGASGSENAAQNGNQEAAGENPEQEDSESRENKNREAEAGKDEPGASKEGTGADPNGKAPNASRSGQNAGEGKPSPSAQAGESGSTPGESSNGDSQSSEQASADNGEPNEANGEPNGNASPSPRNSSTPNESNEDEANADPWNKAYAEEAADLVLDHLKEHPRDIDPEILNDMGWTQKELEAFVKRWESLREQARQGGPRGDQAREELDAALQGLGLTPPKSTLRTTSGERENRSSATERGTTSEPPAAFADQYRAFLQSRQRSAGKAKP
jgi:hypothetical protein